MAIGRESMKDPAEAEGLPDEEDFGLLSVGRIGFDEGRSIWRELGGTGPTFGVLRLLNCDKRE